MIMKRFLLLCLLFVPCLAAQAETYRVEDIPNVQRADRTRYVSNPDGILSDEAVAHIDRLCAALREQAVAQVAVVAVDDIAGGDVFDFAIDLFSAWGVGQARNDNGLGILLVKDRREIRFVTGGGLEGVLPDAICKRIQLKYMLPAFRQGDCSLGMVQGVEAVSQLLEGSELDLGGADTGGDELPAWAVFLIVTGFVVVPMGVILLGYYARKRCPKCHKLTLRQQSSDILKVTPNYRLVEYTYVCSNCGAVVKRQAKNLRDDNFGGRAGGVPEMTLEYVMRQNGVVPGTDAAVDTTVQFNMMAGAFTGGNGDFVTLFEPTATEVAQAGKGYILASIGQESGEIPYTAYFASQAYISDHADIVQRFTNAIARAQKWIAEHDAAQTAEIIAPQFPDTSVPVLTQVVQRYKDIDAWNATPVMTRSSLERLETVMETAGVLAHADWVDFDRLVDNSYAHNAS